MIDRIEVSDSMTVREFYDIVKKQFPDSFKLTYNEIVFHDCLSDTNMLQILGAQVTDDVNMYILAEQPFDDPSDVFDCLDPNGTPESRWMQIKHAYDKPEFDGEDWDRGMFPCCWCNQKLYFNNMIVVDCHEQTHQNIDHIPKDKQYYEFICPCCEGHFTDNYVEENDDLADDYLPDDDITCMVVDADGQCINNIEFSFAIKVTVTYIIEKDTFSQKQLVRTKYICRCCESYVFSDRLCEPKLSIRKPDSFKM